ncbi:hypothetical protein BSKO_13835 [Bryopsis sp. KO-2023]|nr:hypothetical protein BSKO_13835 [Bryopsis sp. KO-2023]
MFSSARVATAFAVLIAVSTLSEARSVADVALDTAIEGFGTAIEGFDGVDAASLPLQSDSVILEDPVKLPLFEEAPMPALYGKWYVCWSNSHEFMAESVFGRCGVVNGNVEAYFPWGGRDTKWPSKWAAVLSKDLFWGINSIWSLDCPEGELAMVKDIGAVNVKMNSFSECDGWTVGKHRPSTGEAWFACNGREVWLRVSSAAQEDIYPLCMRGGAKLTMKGNAVA